MSAPVLRRILAPLALVALLLGVGCSDAEEEALRIDDESYTFDELMDEIGEWQGNEALGLNFQSQSVAVESPTGDPTTDLSGFVIGFMVERHVVLEEFDRRAEEEGLEVDPEAASAAEDQLTAPIPDGDDDPENDPTIADGWSTEYYDSVLDYVSKQFTLADAVGGQQGYTELVGGLMESTEVEVSSRFGRWDEGSQQVLPPEGPVTTTTAFDPLAAGAAG